MLDPVQIKNKAQQIANRLRDEGNDLRWNLPIETKRMAAQAAINLAARHGELDGMPSDELMQRLEAEALASLKE